MPNTRKRNALQQQVNSRRRARLSINDDTNDSSVDVVTSVNDASKTTPAVSVLSTNQLDSLIDCLVNRLNETGLVTSATPQTENSTVTVTNNDSTGVPSGVPSTSDINNTSFRRNHTNVRDPSQLAVSTVDQVLA